MLHIRWFRTLSVDPPLRYRLRDLVRSRIERLYGPRAPFVEAVVLGFRADLDPELRKRFTAGGLAHLLAISGLHVGFVAGWLLLLVRWLGLRRRAWLVSAAGTWAYVVLLGFPPPATRAAAFVAINAVGWARARRPPPDAVLAVAMLVVFTVDPLAATTWGTWLSAAAVWGVAKAGRVARVRGRFAPLLRLLIASIGATAATAPLTALAFGSVAPVGVLANLVAVPLAAVAVPGVFASLGLGEILAAGTGLALSALEAVAAVAASLPGGHLEGSPGVRFALPWGLILAVAIWAGWRRPTWLVARRRLLASTAVVVWACLVVPSFARSGAPGIITIHVLDVGQGDAIAVRTPAGQWILIDGGPRIGRRDAGKQVVVPFFRREQVARLAVLIVSHGDADHLGGVPSIIEDLQPQMVLEPGQALGSNLYLDFLGEVDASGAAWKAARAGDTISVDSVTLAILHPDNRWLEDGLGPNENSLVVHLRYGTFDALFTGDIGAPAESALVDGVMRVELLKVGHHGSGGSSTGPWLDALRPIVAVISVGRGNGYGHPAPEAMGRLGDRGIDVYRTDEGGTVTIRSDGNYFQIMQDRSLKLREWMQCLLQKSLPLSGSSWRESGCTLRRRASSRTFSTISP
jgi:competence protein ComEC